MWLDVVNDIREKKNLSMQRLKLNLHEVQVTASENY